MSVGHGREALRGGEGEGVFVGVGGGDMKGVGWERG